ncbi:MAG: TauD/TfdA family dioxygenase [Pirellulaceae bacterium]|nr:TauD/TfdA family dioxygenase [Pirellulaceae bacterium]
MTFGLSFPACLSCDAPATLDDALVWVRRERRELLARADRHGAVLFRGFPVASAENFDAFVGAFELPDFTYAESLSNAVRINRTPRVFTANEAPPDVDILLHHEMAQTPIYPSRLFFYCERPADTGGATPLCRSDGLLEELQKREPEFIRKCAEAGLRYTNVMPAENDPTSGMGRSWKSTLNADTRAAAEARLARLNYSWEWLADDCLRATTPVLPAVLDLGDERRSFFNQLIAAFGGWRDERNDPSNAITFGDGELLDPDAALAAATLAEQFTVDAPWRAGDVALVDNRVAMHGRRTFTGERSILAAFVS